jgi:hypothetical protein
MTAGDPFRRVHSGEQLEIAADAYNAMLAASLQAKKRRANSAPAARNDPLPGTTLLVKNASGDALGRFAILGIDDAVIAPSDSLTGFQETVAVSGVIPGAAHYGKFCILAEPIDDNAVGRAYVAGACPVQVNVINAEHEFADIDLAGSSTDRLLSNRFKGGARILWKESGTGVKWAIVRIAERFVSAYRFKNDSGETIPAHAAVQLAAGYLAEDDLYLPLGVKPVRFGSRYDVVINGDTDVPNGEIGVYQPPTLPAVALVEQNTPAGVNIGLNCGPIAGSWSLQTSSFGFENIGGHIGAPGSPDKSLVLQAPFLKFFGKTTVPHNKGATANVAVYYAFGPDKTDTGEVLPCYNRFRDLAAGKWVAAEWDRGNDTWELVAGEC